MKLRFWTRNRPGDEMIDKYNANQVRVLYLLDIGIVHIEIVLDIDIVHIEVVQDTETEIGLEDTDLQ